jgi:Coenzyme PQQ synthesis protein D (PqqD)
MLLVLTAGAVHLNQHALAILELCDGSRSRDRVVVDAMMRAPGSLRAADVVDFLEAAQSRGWIVEGE